MRWPTLIFATLLLLSLPSSGESCQCETVTCNPCEQEVDIQFYTSKCDGGRVKSCRRPACAPLNPLPATCQANSAPVPAPAENKKVAKAVEKPSVGTVLMSLGNVELKRNGTTQPLRVNHKVVNDDEISTGENGKVKIIFTDDSNMTLLPKTKTKINHQSSMKDHPSSTVVNLFFGTVRSVVSKSENNQKKYSVETPSAVAGVRGTDFLTTYYESSQTTKVQTLDGTVELASRTGATKTLIPAGHYASYVVDSERENSSASMKYIDSGFITPLGMINNDQRKEIDKKFDFDTERVMASSTPEAKPICSTPTAFFNQCSYQCVNNPKKSGHCRTELPTVKCVRKRCNANGEWADEARLPASDYEKCAPAGITVERCDY